MTKRVTLAGNPNTGKTTLFNALTGSKARIGNYPGVTVESRHGTVRTPGGSELLVVDVPGCYSVTARSLEEEIAHDVVLGRIGGGPADVIVVVADASNPARNLYLLTQLLEFERPVVLALNMMDVAAERGVQIDVPGLAAALKIPVVPIVARTREGLDALISAVEQVQVAGAASPVRPQLDASDQEAVAKVRTALASADYEATLGQALWLLSSNVRHLDRQPKVAEMIRSVRDALRAPLDPERPLDFNRRLIVARYALVDSLCSRFVKVTKPTEVSRTERADRILTHPVWGMGIFILAMTVLFQAVFSWSDPLIGGVETLMTLLSGLLSDVVPQGVVRELLVDGVLAGVGNIFVFLPQIVILFLAITALEETGYMARAALLLDGVMRRVGLHGRAFVPLMSSFACAIPGVMAARTIETTRDRIVTIMVAPLMSCSARLPVYTLVIAAVFASSEPVLGIFSLGGLVITAMYFLGIFAALGAAFVFKRTLLTGPTPPLILELPEYQTPVLREVLLRVYRRARVFVTQTGTVILALSVVLWALISYPRTELDPTQRAAVVAELPAEADEAARGAAIGVAEAQTRLANSFAGRIGKAIEPLIEPLGFDWKIGIGLVGSFAAREVLVSTLGQVYGVGSEVDEESVVLRKALLAERRPDTGEPVFTPLVGLSLMVFFVLAMQCLSTVAVVRRETASWRWPIIMIVYMNALAWLGAFLTYQGGRLLGFT